MAQVGNSRVPIWEQGPPCYPRDPHNISQDDCYKGDLTFAKEKIICDVESLKEDKSVMLDEHFAELEGAR